MGSSGRRDLDAVAGKLAARLLERAHQAAPEEIADSVAEAALALGG